MKVAAGSIDTGWMAAWLQGLVESLLRGGKWRLELQAVPLGLHATGSLSWLPLTKAFSVITFTPSCVTVARYSDAVWSQGSTVSFDTRVESTVDVIRTNSVHSCLVGRRKTTP